MVLYFSFLPQEWQPKPGEINKIVMKHVEPIEVHKKKYQTPLLRSKMSSIPSRQDHNVKTTRQETDK